MKLGDIVHEYRIKCGMSQRQLSAYSGLSSSFINILEKGSKSNGKPLVPTLSAIRNIAKAMHIPLDDILSKLDDDDVLCIKDDDDSGKCLSYDEARLLKMFRSLSSAGQASLLKQAEMHLAAYREQVATDSAL